MDSQSPFPPSELDAPITSVRTTVCVVDDDPTVRQTICSMLESAGYQTSQAHDGKAGLREIERSAAAVAVLDIIMPDHEGIETIALVKERFPNVQILAISGGGTVGPETYLTMARGMGADATLAKPFRADKVLPIVADLIRRAKAPGS